MFVMSMYGWAITALWLFFLVIWGIASVIDKERTHGQDAFRWLTTRGVAIAGVAGFFHMQVFAWGSFTPAPYTASPFIAVLGIFICAAGIVVAVWARLHLGLNWNIPMVERDDTHFVTSGPYAAVRHPIYTGILIAMLGSAFVFGNVWLSIFTVFLVYFLYAAKEEERVMEERFKEAYAQYQKRTHMLIPRFF
jgi:protein-S-isoprenylcysteine O-methyltransferase Ste14